MKPQVDTDGHCLFTYYSVLTRVYLWLKICGNLCNQWLKMNGFPSGHGGVAELALCQLHPPRGLTGQKMYLFRCQKWILLHFLCFYLLFNLELNLKDHLPNRLVCNQAINH